MASLQSKITSRLLFLTGMKNFFVDEDKITAKLAKARAKGPDLPSSRFRKKYDVHEEELDGYPLYTVSPKTGGHSDGKHVLYLHGGGYVLDMTWAHWNFIGRLIDATGVSVSVPIYPLAPESKCENLVALMHSLLQRLVIEHGGQNVSVVGDSAGGGLALALAQVMRDAGERLPAEMILLSPWLDVTASDPSQPEIEPKDPLIALKGLRCCAEFYAGDLPKTDPRVSPLFGSMDGLPPVQIFTGTSDVLLTDARRLRDKLAQSGVLTDYHEYEDMFHVWMLLGIPEGKSALKEISARI